MDKAKALFVAVKERHGCLKKLQTGSGMYLAAFFTFLRGLKIKRAA
jgi:hypothetical protein